MREICPFIYRERSHDLRFHEDIQSSIHVDFHKCRILGACNPPFAYRALQAEDKNPKLAAIVEQVRSKLRGVVERS